MVGRDVRVTEREGMVDYTFEQIAAMIDHSLLAPTLTDEQMEEGCRQARALGVASVCIKPYGLRRCADILAGSGVRPSTTVGFPHGGHATATKVAETCLALADGAAEVDMVINVGKALSGDWGYVRADIAAVVEAAHAGGGLVKVIFENCLLEDAHKVRLCQMCGELGADWVKTSTGYGGGGATVEDVALMRRHAPPHVQVKAAGGVRTLAALLAVRKVGATRVGATATAAILHECRLRPAAGREPSP